jgi:putative transposase
MEGAFRKRRRSFDEPGHAHALTFSCFRRLPLLSSDRSRGWFTDALNVARRKLDFSIWAYVVMPEHVHLLIRPRRPQYRTAAVLAAIKRPVSAAARRWLEESGRADWIERLTVRESGRTVFRFWQAGGGFDENLWNVGPVEAVIRYIHENPVRRGLAANAIDWRWSSARWWSGFRDGPVEMDSPDW